MKIKLGPLLKYTLTPQFKPRIQNLFFSGFSYMAFFMAQIYRTVRLLPNGHPYLNPANMGRFGLRHVIAEAGNNLTFSKEHIDQIVVFAMMVLGLILIGVQLFILLITGFVSVAHAAPDILGAQLYGSSTPLDFFKWFSTPVAKNDVAFVLLDRVFGIPGTASTGTSFFADAGGHYTCVVNGERCFTGLSNSTSSIWDGQPAEAGIDRQIATNYEHNSFQEIAFPWPYHEALRGMLQFYSVGLLVIGVFIFIYFIFALTAETIQTGTPFGRRFNHIWAPLRIVTAMGLLVPITHGLNPAQWILMFAAKWGSSFATNGWTIYSEALDGEDTILGDTENLVATPSNPVPNTLMEFGSLLAVCYEAYGQVFHERDSGRDKVKINAWLINPDKITMAPKELANTTFSQAVDYVNYGSIVVRFGELRNDEHQSWDGRVAPFCGEVTLDLTYVTDNMAVSNVTGPANNTTEPGSLVVLDKWYTLIKDIWCSASGECTATTGDLNGATSLRNVVGLPMSKRILAIGNDLAAAPLPTVQDLTSLRTVFEDYIKTTVTEGVEKQRDSTEWKEDLHELGWAGAAIWYNKIAQLNGGLVSAIYALPGVRKLPYVMEETKKQRTSEDSGVSGETGSRPSRASASPMDFGDANNRQLADVFDETRNLWAASYSKKSRESNFFIDAINMVFGTEGLFNIVSNESANIHPLAQLATIGRTIVDSSIRNLGGGLAGAIAGGAANLAQLSSIGSFSGAIGSFLYQVGVIGLSIGFVLFYIIPFLPFIYFFFAVGTWIKAIFEAMVGVPLWALAHIRIDGDGLPGSAAMGGYYLIMEIFLRPILIIFGFIASMSIFAAQVSILHEIWYLVVSNVSGFQETAAATITGTNGQEPTGGMQYLRREVDEFFFTVIYAIICYMMAMGSFKLIDQIPNQILRWMGASVSTFGDQADDPGEHLVRNAFVGTNMLAEPMKGVAQGMKGMASSGSEAVGSLLNRSKGG